MASIFGCFFNYLALIVLAMKIKTMFELDPPIIVPILESIHFRRQHNNGNERDSWFLIN
jgi:hypothetical protein